MTTPKFSRQIFTCIIIHQTFVLPEPWRRHSTSTSKMVGCRLICLLPIPINKHGLAGIKKLSKNHNMIYQHLFSHWTLIQSQRQKNKTNRHYQEPFEFTLSKMLLFIHQQHQNQMSKLSLTLIFTSDSNLMLLFYFTLVINLGGLEPKHNTLWFHFAL